MVRNPDGSISILDGDGRTMRAVSAADTQAYNSAGMRVEPNGSVRIELRTTVRGEGWTYLDPTYPADYHRDSLAGASKSIRIAEVTAEAAKLAGLGWTPVRL